MLIIIMVTVSFDLSVIILFVTMETVHIFVTMEIANICVHM